MIELGPHQTGNFAPRNRASLCTGKLVWTKLGVYPVINMDCLFLLHHDSLDAEIFMICYRYM